MKNESEKNELKVTIARFVQARDSGNKNTIDISELIAATANLKLNNFDYGDRLIRAELGWKLNRPAPPKWKFWNITAPVLTWIDLCSHDGYKREQTLHSLSGSAPNRFFFALAIRRLNDWVPQVREAASKKLLGLAQATEPEIVADALCAIFPNWHSWERIEDKNILVDIASIEMVRLALKSKILLNTSGPMANIFSQLGRTDVFDCDLNDFAEKAIQPSVRAIAYKCLLERKISWFEGRSWKWTDLRYLEGRTRPIFSERNINIEIDHLDTLKRCATDRSAIVRRVAGEILIREYEQMGPEAITFAKLLATDASRSISERAKFILDELKST